MIRILTITFLLFINFIVVSQNTSVHQYESEYYNQFGPQPSAFWDSLSGYKPMSLNSNSKDCNLNKIVFGWNPYWAGSTYTNYQWDLLSDLCHFSYELTASTGQAASTHNWLTDAAVTAALNNGTRVHLCVTLFSSHATFFGNNTAKQTFISNIISLLQQRGAHGVNIDFEGVPSTQRDSLTSFLISLSNQMHASIPGSMVSVCLPAVDWGPSWDVAALNNYIDLFLIMGYDYYWSSSTTAGPTSPTYSYSSGYTRNVSRSITYYLNSGVSNQKLALGLPYYGYDYVTTSSTPGASTSGSGSTRTYATIKTNSSGYYSPANKQWDSNSWVPYWIYNSGSWHQCYVDDELSFGKKLDLVQQRGLGGIGIWALGYDDGYTELWNTIQNKLTDCYSIACGDSLFDMGGSSWNYFDNEQYSYTIAPEGVSAVTLNFESFATENNYDTLWLYNGNSTSSPLLGTYTGSTSPGLVTSTTNAMTLRFKSDGATTASGFKAIVGCITDNQIPETQISANNWETQTFTATFTDTDNSSISKRFCQVLDNDGVEWRAHGGYGFFNDNFNQQLHSEWTIKQGTWLIDSEHLSQTDDVNGNTNIYAPVYQQSLFEYLYHWQMNITGTGTNQRAGFHFMCDIADSSNRNNSYFIWFRISTQQMEIYEVINNVFTLKKSHSVSMNTNTWYDIKTIYSPTSGLIKVYVNNQFIDSWTDTTPFTLGNFISLRTGNAQVLFDDVKVYRSRGNSQSINPAQGTGMIRYQNIDPQSPSCRIKSVVFDAYENIGSSSLDVNIDWTIPINIWVFDGLSGDTDTSFSLVEMSARWTRGMDLNSDIAEYYYAIGTSAYNTDILPWTQTTDTFFTETGLNLIAGTKYYVSVKAINGAGLELIESSNGQVAETFVNIHNSDISSYQIYPNPCNDYFTIRTHEPAPYTVTLSETNGKIISKINSHSKKVDIHSLPAGMYIIQINNHKPEILIKNEK